ELAGGLAAELSAAGVRRGSRVALMSSNRPEFVVAVRAIWRLGAAVVLISPAWRTVEVTHALDVSGATHAVGDNAVLAGLMTMRDLDE
ncbi:long-chain fatty acid--CoA ligase, partial [Streptomyces sp. SID10244]|nr:long-chain fatty acid--CoA ligase [Streptomyces sp. SID10244]